MSTESVSWELESMMDKVDSARISQSRNRQPAADNEHVKDADFCFLDASTASFRLHDLE